MDKAIERIGKILFEQDVPDFRQYTRCIGLDIGGGNCSAAMVNLLPGNDHMPKQLKLSDIDETSLWSTIGYDALPGKEGEIFIGKQAMNCTYQFSNYKKVPTNENLKMKVSPDNYKPTGNVGADRAVRRSLEELNRDYIRMLYKRILTHPENRRLGGQGKTLIIVGHPSSDDWRNEESHRNLVRIVQEATGTDCVLTTSESNSAILYALNVLEQKLGRAKTCLIVDLGAYSGDITWIDRENLVRCYASMELGGKFIDQNIAEIILENTYLSEKDLAKAFNLLYEARRLKEQFWPSGEEDVTIYVDSAVMKNPTITKAQFNKAVTQMPIPVTDPFTGDVRNVSYTEHLSTFLEEAKTELGITQVDWVLVTGGAARMKPAMEVICSKAQELWGVPQGYVWPPIIDNQLIDESVCFGNLYFYLKSQEVLEKIPGVYEDLKQKAKEMISPMAGGISQGILNYLMPKAVEPILREFRDTEKIQTIDKLESHLKVELNKTAHWEKIRQIANQEATTAANDAKPKFQSIITKFLDELYGRSTGNALWNWSATIKPATIDVASISKIVQETLSDSLLEVIIGFLLLITLGWLLLLFAVPFVLIDSLLEDYRNSHYTEAQKAKRAQIQQQKEAEEEKKRKQKEAEERRKPRTKSERKRVYKKVMDGNAQEQLRAKLQQEIADKLEQTWAEDGFGVADAYLEQLTEDICKAVYTGL